MHRKPLLDLLARYRARHPDEAACVDRVRSLVALHPDCFERTCEPGHVTGSALVLDAERRRVLLVHHRKLDRWLQPGGHADGQTDVASVALAEAREETGLEDLVFLDDAGGPFPIDVDVHRIPARRGEPEHEHHDVRYLLIAAPGAVPRVSEESHDVRWFPLDLAALARIGADASLLRLVRKARARVGAGEEAR